MAKTYHKSVSDDGGAIGDQILAGNTNAIFGEVSKDEQDLGATISRKFYIANSGAEDIIISALSMSAATPFSAILFESTGDSQVVGDLTGAETDESPIKVTIPAGGHKPFWVQIEVDAGSNPVEDFFIVKIKEQG